MTRLIYEVMTRWKARREVAWGRLLLIGVALGYAVVLILTPIAALVTGTLGQGLGALLSLAHDPDLWSALGLSVRIAILTTAVNGVCGVLVAWVLVRYRFPGRAVITRLIDLPFALSPVVVGYLLILLFGRLGPLSGIEDALNIRIAFAVPGMVLVTIFVTLPFMIRELMPVLETLDREQERAAATLGARGWQTFVWVTLPAIRWGLLYGLALVFARALGEFGAVLVAGGAIQGLTETAPLYIFRALDQRDTAAAFSVALALALVSLTLVVGGDRVRKRQPSR
jgi:sulfate transport system permease protein